MSSNNVSSTRYIQNDYECAMHEPQIGDDDYSEKNELLESLDHIPSIMKHNDRVSMPMMKVKRIEHKKNAHSLYPAAVTKTLYAPVAMPELSNKKSPPPNNHWNAHYQFLSDASMTDLPDLDE